MSKSNQAYSFAIGIPTLNRFDLLQDHLDSYVRDFPNTQIYILDNGNQDIQPHLWKPMYKNIVLIEEEKNIGVAASWNKLCDFIYNVHTHALILNDDIYLGTDKYTIEDLINKKPEPVLYSNMGWCSFILPQRVFEYIGRFNEEFYPAYYEDDDYVYRMKLNRLIPLKTPMLNPKLYRNSETIKKDPSIIEYSIKNKRKYIEMWGGLPREEKFIKPYNK